MTLRRWTKLLIAVWTLLAIGAAAAISSGYGPAWDLPDAFHLVGHLVILGGLAWVLDHSYRCKPAVSLLAAIGVGLGIEFAQAAASGRLLAGEMAFDLVVDVLAGMAGLALGRRARAALAITGWLQPRIVVPIGLMGILYAATRDPQTAFRGMAVLAGCTLPAILIWHLRGKGGAGDTPEASRRERRRCLALCTLSAGLFLGAALGLHFPPSIVAAAVAMAFVTTSFLVGSLLGLALSIPVTAPLLCAVVVAPWSPRGIVLLVAAAILLSWGHLRLGRCRRAEVLGSWILGAALVFPRFMLV